MQIYACKYVQVQLVLKLDYFPWNIDNQERFLKKQYGFLDA